jgi:hypothetical protein
MPPGNGRGHRPAHRNLLLLATLLAGCENHWKPPVEDNPAPPRDARAPLDAARPVDTTTPLDSRVAAIDVPIVDAAGESLVDAAPDAAVATITPMEKLASPAALCKRERERGNPDCDVKKPEQTLAAAAPFKRAMVTQSWLDDAKAGSTRYLLVQTADGWYAAQLYVQRHPSNVTFQGMEVVERGTSHAIIVRLHVSVPIQNTLMEAGDISVVEVTGEDVSDVTIECTFDGVPSCSWPPG